MAPYSRALAPHNRVLLLLPALVLVGGFFFLPLLWVVRVSFYQSTGSLTFTPGLVLNNYTKFLSSPHYLGVFWNSVELATVVTLLALALGFPLAYLMVRSSPRVRAALIGLLMVVIWVPIILGAYGWFLTLSASGLVNWLATSLGLVEMPLSLTRNFWAVAVGMMGWSIPYMVLPIYAAVQGIDPDLETAACDLGAGPWRTLAEVTLPLSLPGLASGAILVWTWAVGEYVAPVVLGGGTVRVMSQELAAAFLQRLDWPFGAAACILLLIPMGGVVWFLGKHLGRTGGLTE